MEKEGNEEMELGKESSCTCRDELNYEHNLTFMVNFHMSDSHHAGRHMQDADPLPR